MTSEMIVAMYNVTRWTRGARPALTDFQKASHRTRTG